MQFRDTETAITTLGEIIAGSGVFGCTNRKQGELLAVIAMQEGRTLHWLMRTFHILQGKPLMRAHAILANFRKMGGRHQWLKDGEDGKAATLHLVDPDGNELTYSFTAEMAQAQGLVGKGAWKTQIANMLRARCISNAVLMLAPEILCGDQPDGDDEAVPVETGKVEVTPEALLPEQTPPAEPVVVRETVQDRVTSEFDDIISEFLPWLRGKNWVPVDGTIADLSDARCERVLNNPEKTRAAVAKWVASQIQQMEGGSHGQ